MSTNQPEFPEGEAYQANQPSYEPSELYAANESYATNEFGTAGEFGAADEFGTAGEGELGYARTQNAAALAAPQRSIGKLVADAADDFGTIIRGEIQLAKAEVTSGVKVAGIGAVFAGVAAATALFGAIFLLHAIAQVIALWLPLWAGYLIVALVLFVLTALLGYLAYRRIIKARPVPKRAIAEAQQTVAALKNTGR